MQYTYTDRGKILTIQSPNGVIVDHKYDEDGNLIEVQASDGTIHYMLEYLDENTIKLSDYVSQITLIKEFNQHANLTKEIFPNGQEIQFKYEDGDLVQICFPNNGYIHYAYDDENNLVKVSRFSLDRKLLYEHGYTDFDKEGNARKESLIHNLGEISYEEVDENTFLVKTLYSKQILQINQDKISITTDGHTKVYPLDKLGQITINHGFDSLGNPVQAKVNERNELLQYGNIKCFYDDNGNLIKEITPDKTVIYRYDALNRLCSFSCNEMEARFAYDLEGRRLFKEILKKGIQVKKHYYIYAQDQEIGTIDENGKFKQLRILGESDQAIVIETEKEAFVPIHSCFGNILKLINSATKETIDYSELESFGSNLYQLINKDSVTPWIYASKHFDLESQLVYFGARYYNPKIKRWLTLDPIGRLQTANLYNYVLNNPLLLIDKDGKSAFVAMVPLLKWGGKKVAIAMIPGAGQALTLLGIGWTLYEGTKIGYSAYKGWKDKNDNPPYSGKDLGNNPLKRPGKDFKWKGKGSPESGRGAWYNKRKKQSLHPDFDHPGNVKPHWDYKGPEGEAQLFLDGTWNPK